MKNPLINTNHINIANKDAAISAMFPAAFIATFINPLDTELIGVTTFKNVFGLATSVGIDVSKRSAFFLLMFAVFAASFIVFYFLGNRLCDIKRNPECRRAISALKYISVFGIISLGFSSLSFFFRLDTTGVVFNYSTTLFLIFYILAYGYVLLGLDKKLTSDEFIASCISAFSLGYPISIVLGFDASEGKTLLFIQFILMLIIMIASKWLPKIPGISTVIISLIPFFTSLFIETVNILVGRGISVHNPILGYGILIIVIIGLAIFFGILRPVSFDSWKSYVYPFLIIGIICLSLQLPLQQLYETDIVESANAGVLITDSLSFGKTPIVEHYGGHMMTGVWEGFIYALLNGDITGAGLSPYSEYLRVLISVLFYFFIKKVLKSPETAIILTLLFPIYIALGYYGLGFLIILAMWKYIENNTWKNAALVWLSFVWICLYRLDIGFSMGFGALIALCIYIISEKNLKAFKQILISFVITLASVLCIWSILCILKGLSPISRLREFLAITMSDTNWGFIGIGESNTVFFGICYVLVPLIMVFCLLQVVFSKELKKQTGLHIWSGLLALGFAYFLNFPRGLTRHSLAEGRLWVVLFSSLLFMAIYLTYKANTLLRFVPVLGIMVMLSGAYDVAYTMDEHSFADLSAKKDGNELLLTAADTNGSVTRVVSKEKETFDKYAPVIDALLEDDETFIDFMNVTYLYSALGRKNPAYISQSPLQLSGEFSQHEFISQVKDVPILLMPMAVESMRADLDIIKNNFRYYLVSEYLWQNYRPLLSYDKTYAIWCKNDLREKLLEKVPNDPHIKLIDYGYDASTQKDDQGLHYYYTGNIPLYWSELGDINTQSKIKDLIPENNIFSIGSVNNDQKKSGNFLKLTITCNQPENTETPSLAILGKLENEELNFKNQFAFNIRGGTHTYLIRISTDYYWYAGEIDTVQLASPVDLQSVSMELLSGE